MALRSAVCAERTTASSNCSTSSTAFCASHTIQKAMASTLTGTVSAVSVVSALKSVTRIRWSTNWATLSMTGTIDEQARLREAPELAEAQHHRALPLVGDLDRRGDQGAPRRW